MTEKTIVLEDVLNKISTQYNINIQKIRVAYNKIYSIIDKKYPSLSEDKKQKMAIRSLINRAKSEKISESMLNESVFHGVVLYKGTPMERNKKYIEQTMKQYYEGMTPTDKKGRALVIDIDNNGNPIDPPFVVRYRSDGSYFKVTSDKELTMFAFLHKEGTKQWNLLKVRAMGTDENGRYVADLVSDIPVMEPIKIRASVSSSSGDLFLSKKPLEGNNYWGQSNFYENKELSFELDEMLNQISSYEVEFSEVEKFIREHPYQFFWLRAIISFMGKETQYGSRRIVISPIVDVDDLSDLYDDFATGMTGEEQSLSAWLNKDSLNQPITKGSEAIMFCTGYVKSSDNSVSINVGGVFPTSVMEEEIDFDSILSDMVVSEEEVINSSRDKDELDEKDVDDIL